MSGLPTIEGAVFALIGLLVAFTISGALQRFDERRQLIVQEANAVMTADDRLALLGADARGLQTALKDYTKALHRSLHDAGGSSAVATHRSVVAGAASQDWASQEQALGCGDRRVPSIRLPRSLLPRAAHTFQCL